MCLSAVRMGMATLDVGAAKGRRSVNHELPLVPFIDFLLCIVAFLLVTAVWSRMAELDVSAAVPRAAPVTPDEPLEPSPVLHVDMRSGDRFVLTWRLGATVISEETVPKILARNSPGDVRYPSLADAVTKTWNAGGRHRSASDPERDVAVLHSGNEARFEDVVAVMDAIHAVQKPAGAARRLRSPFAFDVVFAVD